MLPTLDDTIVACATPRGEGAIAVVRLSGKNARQIGQKLGAGKNARGSHELHLVTLRYPEHIILDQCLIAEMFAPHSFTGEDTVEFFTHGSRIVVQQVLDACLALGARHAEPGEFTLRAFMYGRMDLSQCEAVIDLIQAQTIQQGQAAALQLEGSLTKTMTKNINALENLLAEWRTALDFPEHWTGAGFDGEKSIQTIDFIIENNASLLRLSRLRNLHGRSVVLCGAPNVGKSTLLNTWLGYERVLVDSAPGTTRDPVEVEMTSGLIRWSVCDTAGIRQEAQGLEARGAALSMDRIRDADLVLWLMSPIEPIWPAQDLNALIVLSKIDLATPEQLQVLETKAKALGAPISAKISTKTGVGVTELRAWIASRFEPDSREQAGVIVRERHAELLRQCNQHLFALKNALAEHFTLDVLVIELEGAIKALGQILGKDVDADVLEKIFAQFCVGK